MDTKLKRYSPVLKITAFVLLIVCTVSFFLSVIWVGNEEEKQYEKWRKGQDYPIQISDFLFDDFYVQEYRNSRQAWNEYYEVQGHLNTVYMYQNRDKILNGDYITANDLEVAKELLFEEKLYLIESNVIVHDEMLEENYYSSYEYWRQKQREYFEEHYADEISNLKSSLLANQLAEFDYALKYLNENSNIAYCIYDDNGQIVIRNVDISPDQFRERGYDLQYYDIDGRYETDSYNWIYALKDDYYSTRNSEFLAVKKQATNIMTIWVVCFLLWAVCLIYLIYAAGKRDESDAPKVTMLFYDKILNEFTVCIGGLAAFGVAAMTYTMVKSNYPILTGLILLIIMASISYCLFFSLIRHIKNGTFFTNTIIYRILHWFVCLLRKAFTKVNPFWKNALLLVLFGLITAIPFMFIITLPIAVWFTYRQGKNYTKLKNGAAAVRSGRFREEINLPQNSTFAPLAEDLNDIAAGLQGEVERRVKSERLKAELIVNVSHDIKTPLTSLITYTDLLKKEPTDNENIRKYAEVLEQKSARLKTLIEDLFESAKAASGNIPVNFENVDVNALIQQGLGEMDDKIKASELDFKVNLPEEKVYAHADGQLLWRVFENLISNALKYSMYRSRVYIDVMQASDSVQISFKNISAEPLNIPEEEIIERFKRGDVSRSSDGSGLGLDIAKSLMICQGGSLTIKIDGDLFKAIVIIPAT